MKRLRVFYIALFAFAAFFANSCDLGIGLGGAIDVYYAQGEIDYPEAGETPLRGSFDIGGTAKDDVEVEAVSVLFENIVTKERTRSYEATVTQTGGGNAKWVAHIENEPTGSESGHPLVKLYPIMDGEYTAVVSLTDSNGKTTEISKTYKIDNTPPVLIVERPSTLTTDGTAEKYGAVVKIVGEIGETNTPSSISLRYGDSGNVLTKDNKERVVNIQMAQAHFDSFGNYIAAGDYESVKSAQSADSVKAGISVRDNAGNESEFYYIKANIESDVLNKGYTAQVISDYFSGKKGDAAGDTNEQLLAQLRGDTKALYALENYFVDGVSKKSTFHLDPNKTPFFTIMGYEPVTNDGGVKSTAYDSNTTLTFELRRNKDKNELLSSANVEKLKESGIKIVAYKADVGQTVADLLNIDVFNSKYDDDARVKQVLFDAAEKTDMSGVTVGDGLIQISCVLPSGFTSGLYKIDVQGKDGSGNEGFMAVKSDGTVVEDSIFAIKFTSTSIPPEVNYDNIQYALTKEALAATAETLEQYELLNGSENKDSKKVWLRLFVNSQSPVSSGSLSLRVDEKSSTANLTRNSEKDYIDRNSGVAYEAWETADGVDISALEGNPKMVVLFTNDKGGTNPQVSLSYTVDFTSPKIIQETPDLSSTYFKKIELRGIVTDPGARSSGADDSSVKFAVGSTKPEDSAYAAEYIVQGSSEKSVLRCSSGSWTLTIEDISKYKDDPAAIQPQDTTNSKMYILPVWIIASDKAGNESEPERFNILFDPDGGTPVLTVESPVADGTYGGSVMLSGSSSVSNQSSGRTVRTIQVKFAYTKEDLAGADIKELQASSDSGIYHWQKNYEASQWLNGAVSKDVWFTVRGINDVGTECEWTAPQKFIVRSDVAQFGNVQVENGGETKEYVANSLWVRGDDFKVTGTVMHENGISSLVIRATSGSEAPELQTADVSDGSKSGKKFTIPIKTSDLQDKSGTIEFDIAATDGRTDGATEALYKIQLKYDNTAPAAVFGANLGLFSSATFVQSFAKGVSCTDKDVYNLAAASSSSSADSVLSNIVLFAEVGDGTAKVIEISKITKGSGINTVDVTFKQDSGITGLHTCVLVRRNQIVYNTDASNYQLQGYAYDTGSGLRQGGKIDVKLSTLNETVSSDNDFYVETGSFVRFQYSLNTSNVADGKHTLALTPTDVAGNTGSVYECEVFVRNKPLKLTKADFKTDLNSNSTYENINGTLTEIVSQSGDDNSLSSDKNYTQNINVSSKFTIKNKDKSEIELTLSGGEGERTYKLLKGGTEIKSGNSANGGTLTISFANGDFGNGKIEDGNSQSFTLVVTDEASKTDTARTLTLNLTLNVQVNDSTPPNANISPFYWNSASGNSLYENSTANGHIELESDLPSNFTDGNTNGEYDRDPKVSGKIVVKGTVSDNKLLSAIYLSVPGMEAKFANVNTLNVASTTYYLMATYSKGKWTSAKNSAIGSDGFVFTATDTRLDSTGHTAEWTLSWDTSKIANVAQNDVKVQVLALDAASGSGNQSATGTVQTKTGALTSYYKMDVVPYITGLTTKLTKLERRNPSVYGRSALGKYPVYYYRKTTGGTTSAETITVNGFNISSGTVTFAGNATGNISSSGNSIAIPAGATSGKISISVNSVSSLNNVNNNDAKGSYTGNLTSSIFKTYAYNRQPNGQNNDLLTDDVELAIWEINSQAAKANSGELSEVVMHVNPANGMLGFAFAHSQDLASYPKGTTNSYNTWITDWTGVNQIGFTFDSKGNMWGTNGGTDTSTADQKAGRFGLISSIWDVITTVNVQDDNVTGYTGWRRLRLEYLGYWGTNTSYSSNVYRFDKGSRSQFAVTTPKNNADKTNLYMMYYDNMLSELKFKAGVYDTAVNRFQNVSKPSDRANVFKDNTVKFGDFADDAYNNTGDSQDNYNPNYATTSIVSNVQGANGKSDAKPGIYYSIAAVPGGTAGNDVVVAVWYDGVNKNLWYSYIENPLQNAGKRTESSVYDSSNKLSKEWSTPKAILDGHAGGYCAIAVDEDKHIHIAAFSTNDAGSLYYAYLDDYHANNYSESKNLVAVDSYGSAGQHITMELAKNAAGKTIPYIGYWMNSMSRPKYAYLTDTAAQNGTVSSGVDDDNMYTGKWESIMLPTSSSIVEDRINIGVYKEGAAGKIKAIPKQTENAGDVNGTAGGNDTSNPVLGYGISNFGQGYVETAQLK